MGHGRGAERRHDLDASILVELAALVAEQPEHADHLAACHSGTVRTETIPSSLWAAWYWTRASVGSRGSSRRSLQRLGHDRSGVHRPFLQEALAHPPRGDLSSVFRSRLSSRMMDPATSNRSTTVRAIKDSSSAVSIGELNALPIVSKTPGSCGVHGPPPGRVLQGLFVLRKPPSRELDA